jgi:hypothetical protein
LESDTLGTTAVTNRISEALRNAEPGSQLDAVRSRWDGFEHSVQQNGDWKLEGFITYFQHCHEMMRAIDPSLPSTLPARCFDPTRIAGFFGIPVEEFGVESTSDGTKEQSAIDDETPLQQAAEALMRIADHLAPPPPAVVGTPYVAGKLDCSTEWITEMIRTAEIPRHFIVPGTGNGKPWKLDRKKIDKWLKNR